MENLVGQQDDVTVPSQVPYQEITLGPINISRHSSAMASTVMQRRHAMHVMLPSSISLQMYALLDREEQSR